MKVIIFSDVHGNLPALEIMLAAEKNADQYIFLGDAVNYGPWSNECVELIANVKNVKKILGNHDESFITGNYSGGNIIAKAFFEFCYPRFSKQVELVNYLQQYTTNDYTCTHTILNKYIYPDTEINFDRNYFIGHSHHQFNKKSNQLNLYNCGSVGQNRRFINVISYLIWYPTQKKIVFKNIPYNIDVVINKMCELDYPKICLDYYLTKERA